MVLNASQGKNISVYLLIFYCYLTWLRTLVLPQTEVFNVALIVLSFFLVLSACKFRIYLSHGSFKTQSLVWIAIYLLICLNNTDIFSNFVSKGMIQLAVMIVFMLTLNENTEWVQSWFRMTAFCAILHSIGTIVFNLIDGIYPSFARAVFTGDRLERVLMEYSRGIAPGLASNNSANGMILSVCFIVCAIRFMMKERKQIHDYLLVGLVAVALLISGKRGPVLFAFLSILASYMVKDRSRNGIVKGVRILIYAALGVGLFLLLSRYIPGLDRIIVKTVELQDTSKGVLNGRQGLWNIAIDMYKSAPIIGKGYGSYNEYAEALEASTTSAHNYFLQIAAELGTVGLILYVAAFLSGVFGTVKLLLNRTTERYTEYLYVSLAVQLFVILYSLSATSLMYYAILIPYFIACAVPRACVEEAWTTEEERI